MKRVIFHYNDVKYEGAILDTIASPYGPEWYIVYVNMYIYHVNKTNLIADKQISLW